jgi:acetoacetate decarboxylase
MTNVRYGARSEAERRNREAEATATAVWAKNLTAWYETDPDIVRAVLPRPLEPTGEPLVRITITITEIGDRPPFGAGVVAVRARHEGTVGDYALVMPMATEQSVIGGREMFGEPKKLGEVSLTRDGDQIVGTMTRLGVTFAEVSGRVTGPLELPEEQTRTAFYFKFLMDPSGKGFDTEPALVYCYRTEQYRSYEQVEGTVTLRESPFDPVVDLPVRRLTELTYSERSSQQRGEIVSRVPSEWLEPFAHQRYDDLSPLGKR